MDGILFFNMSLNCTFNARSGWSLWGEWNWWILFLPVPRDLSGEQVLLGWLMHSGVIVQIWSRHIFPKPLRLVSLMGNKPTLASYALKKKKERKTNYQPTANVIQLKSLKDKGIGDKCSWREGWAVTCLLNGSSMIGYRITCYFSLLCVSSEELLNICKYKRIAQFL